ncbi:hypothetical protein [Amycolatopsis jiangsuensis]|uniref:Excreted virulence factor EspC (Type VII ESX diderm) n=1 Tax=Amycolatopsis jiangsuensis TaxID=1181879 RepID=A0A840IY32_9PSEU|nr:hypothetical protein [Amycolatopsis jiangsuensis]MBB4686419.1 hypothetical protein [Amycolatopsis jiangsuensis]
MAGGHRVDTEALTKAAKALGELPRSTVQQPLSAVKDVQIAKGDFGEAHSGNFDPYHSGVLRLAGMVDGYLRASDAFAQRLNSAGGQYRAGEEANTEAVERNGQ